MPLPPFIIVDLSIDLDPANFKMRTYAGFKKDMQFELETIKEYPGGLNQIVRGVHMRLHAGSHVDAPSHMLEGAPDLHQMPLERFIGPAVVADIRHRAAGEEVRPEDLEKAVGDRLRSGDRLLLRTDQNDVYDGSPEWMARAPYLYYDAVDWCIERGVSIVGYDFYHGGMPAGSDRPYYARKLSEHGIMTMPYLTNLGAGGRPAVHLGVVAAKDDRRGSLADPRDRFALLGNRVGAEAAAAKGSNPLHARSRLRTARAASTMPW